MKKYRLSPGLRSYMFAGKYYSGDVEYTQESVSALIGRVLDTGTPVLVEVESVKEYVTKPDTSAETVVSVIPEVTPVSAPAPKPRGRPRVKKVVESHD